MFFSLSVFVVCSRRIPRHSPCNSPSLCPHDFGKTVPVSWTRLGFRPPRRNLPLTSGARKRPNVHFHGPRLVRLIRDPPPVGRDHWLFFIERRSQQSFNVYRLSVVSLPSFQV